LHPFNLQAASFTGAVAEASARFNSHTWRMLRSPLAAAELLAEVDPSQVIFQLFDAT
jgi:hypothetical protein